MKAFNEYEQNENGAFDIPIGETFNYKGFTLKVILDDGNFCANCYVRHIIDEDDYSCGRLSCANCERKDNESVIFEKVKE